MIIAWSLRLGLDEGVLTYARSAARWNREPRLQMSRWVIECMVPEPEQHQAWERVHTHSSELRRGFVGSDYPYLTPELPTAPRNHNALLHEDDNDILLAAHTPLLVPPSTSPGDYVPRRHDDQGLLTYEQLPDHPREIYIDESDTGGWARRCRWEGALRSMGDTCTRLAAQGKEYKPKYSLLEGGRNGMVIPASARKPRFRTRVMDIGRWEREGCHGKVHECTDADPATRTDWNLPRITACAERRERAKPGTQDMQTPWEAQYYGLDNRSEAPMIDMCVPPYPSYWERQHFEFAMAKIAEKQDVEGQRFDKPRLTPARRHLPTCPAIVPAITVAETLAGKMRMAIDFGSSRSHDSMGQPGWQPTRAKQSGPLSVNAHEHKSDVPPFDFMRPADLWRRAAIMMQAAHVRTQVITEQLDKLLIEGGAWYTRALMEAALARRATARQMARMPPPGLRIVTIVSDQAAWYEQSPAPSYNDWMKVIAVAFSSYLAQAPAATGELKDTTRSKSCVIDPRTCFGDRLAAFLTYLMTMQGIEELRFRERPARQRALERGEVPAECRPGLYRWMDARVAIGEEPAWIEPGAFFDDSQFLIFAFFLETSRPLIFDIWREWNFDVADGTRQRKDKVEEAVEPACPIILGEQAHMAARRRGIPEAKLAALDALVEAAIEESARHPGRGTACKQLERIRGRATHMADAKRTMKGDLQVSYELEAAAKSAGGNRQSCHQRFHVIKAEDAARLRQVAARARHDKGSSFFPRTGWIGKRGRGILQGATDASGDVDAVALEQNKFRGWGGWVHIEGTNIVFVVQQHFTRNARKTLLDSTALELAANNEFVRWTRGLIRLLQSDVLNISDSTSASAICMGARSRGAAERELYAQRCTLLDSVAEESPDVAILTHAVRRGRNEEADLLTKRIVFKNKDGYEHEPAAARMLEELFEARFGRPMCIIHTDAPAGARERLTPVLRRHERSMKFAQQILRRAMRKRIRVGVSPDRPG